MCVLQQKKKEKCSCPIPAQCLGKSTVTLSLAESFIKLFWEVGQLDDLTRHPLT